jgi:hypothetical protein
MDRTDGRMPLTQAGRPAGPRNTHLASQPATTFVGPGLWAFAFSVVLLLVMDLSKSSLGGLMPF